MEAHERSFTFMAMASYYDIPFFQRAYVWDEENWQELLNNFLDQTDSHFLGSIILKQEKLISGSYPRYMIIDGQQRLTTLSILTRACYDRLIEDKEMYEDSVVNGFKTDLHNLLFIKPNKYASHEDVKIQHSKLDAPAFQEVINGKYSDCILENGEFKSDYKKIENKIIGCYLYFRKELHACSKEDVHKIWDLLTEEYPRYLVNIDLDYDENEQKIFDTVNSFGVRLSSADTIKNAVFQSYIEALRKDYPQDVRKMASGLYEKTWEQAFEADDDVRKYWETARRYGRMSRDNLEVFLYSFAVINGFFDPAADNMVSMPQKYKNVLNTMDHKEIEEFLQRIRRYAEIYSEYFSNFDSDSLFTFSDYKLRLLHICHTLDVATFYPYIIKLLYENEVEKTISDGQLQDLFMQLERYIILNAVCDGSTKNYNNECVQLVRGRKIPDELKDASSYISRKAFDDGIINLRQNKLPTVLLFWVELYNRDKAYSDIKNLKYDFTLEHIMPQKWQANWSVKDVPVYDEEGKIVTDEKEARDIRSAAVYEIGNMTLLNSKLNSSISNGTFYTKVNGDGKKNRRCMKDLADLYLTREVIKEAEWNETKIYERTERIQQQIEEIWNIEFEEDKPIHFEFDENDIVNSFYDTFGNMSFADAADQISRADCSDEIKGQMISLLFESFINVRISNYTHYNNNIDILRKDDKELLHFFSSYGLNEIASIINAVDARNEAEVLALVSAALKDTNTTYHQNVDELVFFDFAMNPVKNRFTDFYESLYERLADIETTPEVPELCQLLDEYYRSENPQEQIEALEKYEPALHESIIFNALAGGAYYDNKQWQESIRYLERFLTKKVFGIFSEDSVHTWLGYAYHQIGNHQECINHYMQCIEINPENGDVLNRLGND